MSIAIETCANCKAGLGPVGSGHVWKSRVICGSCFERLCELQAEQTPESLIQWVPIPRPAKIACSNAGCGYVGTFARGKRRSYGALSLLLLLGILPGVLYAFFTRHPTTYCPRCKNKEGKNRVSAQLETATGFGTPALR